MRLIAKRILAHSSLVAMAPVLVVICGPAGAEEGTLAQRRACEPDVFRLCKEFIPDHTAITSCLERNKARLNPDCRAVFERTESRESEAQNESPRKKTDLVGAHKAVAR
jgi:hypothetical protein